MAQSNEVETDVWGNEVESKVKWDNALKSACVIESQLTMEQGDEWWNYIINFILIMEFKPHVCGEFEFRDVPSKRHRNIKFEQTAVYKENKHGIVECVGKKLITIPIGYNNFDKVRLVDKEYVCEKDEYPYDPSHDPHQYNHETYGRVSGYWIWVNYMTEKQK